MSRRRLLGGVLVRVGLGDGKMVEIGWRNEEIKKSYP
jgi:hypothetical protein